MLIHNNAKARVRDLGHRRINRVAGWDSPTDVLSDDELQFCHIQGYEPRIFRIDQSRDPSRDRNRVQGGRGPDRRGFDR
jgi:hypothetical protein